jgi:RNA polymerase sigma factor (sigma-70 family)
LGEPKTFESLIEQLRRGDHEAARVLLQRYEPALRRIASLRLMDRRLRGLVDHDDICQSVFGSFFVRLALGQYELTNESDLLRLLATMVRNKVASKQRRRVLEHREDVRLRLDRKQVETQARVESPSQCLVFDELIRVAEGMLSPEERELIALRKQGVGWQEIADRMGDDPERLRKRLARTADLVIEQLGLEETRRGGQ